MQEELNPMGGADFQNVGGSFDQGGEEKGGEVGSRQCENLDTHYVHP